MKLVIVESPSKAKTIEKYLGSGFKVLATYGHLRDLPPKKLGVLVAHDFKPQYETTEKAKENVRKLKKEAAEAKEIYLATDFDREGEAIAWHFLAAITPKSSKERKEIEAKAKRITFYEITKSAISQSVSNPRQIDMALVDAQQARRVLDRLVGYKLSPLLWRKIRRGLSAGRVQSVTVRLIVEREREREAFKPEEYWEIEANLSQSGSKSDRQKEEFAAKLFEKNGEKVKITNEKESKEILGDLDNSEYKVSKITQKEVSKNPSPPFTTSTLQQAASNKLGFSAKKTMMIAQQLYEGIDLGGDTVGLITYIRTDSLNVAKEAVEATRNYINQKFGKQYLPETARAYKTKTIAAQEAHEAIRPTDVSRDPNSLSNQLSKDQAKLYRLIWTRMVASQMAPAKISQTSIDIAAAGKENEYLFRASGSVVKFPSFYEITKQHEENENANLPELKEDELLKLLSITPSQHFTQPPARYTEASLIKTLEEYGIGRPSTYAPIIATIQDRGYVSKEEKNFFPNEIGYIVTDLLVEHFPDIVDYNFTASMEEKLDQIAEGKQKWVPVMREFWEPFSKTLKIKLEEIAKINTDKPTDEKCELCGKPMVIKQGRFGEFLACTGYPDCKNTKTIIEEVGVPCPEDGGRLIVRRTRKGKVFYGCENWPSCKFATWDEPYGGKPCPSCGGLLTKKGKLLKCTKCDFKEYQKKQLTADS